MAKKNKTSEVTIKQDAKIEKNASNKKQDAQVQAHEKITLKINVNFTDKYTGKEYKINDEIPFEKERAEELLRDVRNLVSKVGE